VNKDNSSTVDLQLMFDFYRQPRERLHQLRAFMESIISFLWINSQSIFIHFRDPGTSVRTRKNDIENLLMVIY
jgi:hypothetical protein